MPGPPGDESYMPHAVLACSACPDCFMLLQGDVMCHALQGVFMLAFRNATDAVCWAMLLNMALLRYTIPVHNCTSHVFAQVPQ